MTRTVDDCPANDQPLLPFPDLQSLRERAATPGSHWATYCVTALARDISASDGMAVWTLEVPTLRHALEKLEEAAANPGTIYVSIHDPDDALICEWDAPPSGERQSHPAPSQGRFL